MRCIAIACLGLFAFAGCAFEEPEEELAAAEDELAALEAGEADGVVTSEPTEEELAATSPRYMVGDGNCHSFDYLRYWSNWYCQHVWSASSHATSRDYQVGCSRGAKYVSFVCVGG